MEDPISTQELLKKISEHFNLDKKSTEKKVLHNTRGVITLEDSTEEDSSTPGGDENPDDPDQPDIPEDFEKYLEEYLKGYVHFVGDLDCSSNVKFPAAKQGECYIIAADGMFGTFQVQKGEVVICIAEESPESDTSDVEDNWKFLIRHASSTGTDIEPMPNELIDLIMEGKTT